MNKFDVIIIGGGAAGFAVASFLNGNGYKKNVLIIERNAKSMRKLAITGKGRCNLTNHCDNETLFGNLIRNPAFMRSALARFSPSDTMKWFEGMGVPLKVERGGRVFPVSDNAFDVVDALRRAAGTAKVVHNRVNRLIYSLTPEIPAEFPPQGEQSSPFGTPLYRFSSKIGITPEIPAEFSPQGGQIRGVGCENGEEYYSENVVVATGGMSYPATGSTGDGYELARLAGHSISPLKPALVPLETIEDFSAMSGLTLKNVKLTLKKGEKSIYSEQGEMLFTHFGVSGPLILTASCYMDSPPEEYTLSIDFKPALDERTLDARILRDFAENKNRQFKNSLSGLLPEKLVDVFVEGSRIEPFKQVNAVSKEERRRLVSLFKAFRLGVKGFRPIEEAIVTDGGVCVREISPKTMQSKLVKGLYFAGEVADVFGLTGGFNLQIAFSTAYAAAMSINQI
ncbi:MAG: NAD(P)/FAD-dependent oxidoreductase [Oscillospiraceae bacterium]|nr:NAD(P)/FAD-dependent oxidoreductase [Oscillospiraceae bacterium]